MTNTRLSIVSRLNYFRLVYRSMFFLVLLYLYITCRLNYGVDFMDYYEKRPLILRVIWLVFVVETCLRFFPAGFQSPGCQKHFARNYMKSGRTDVVIQDNNATLLVAFLWVGFNGIFGSLYTRGIVGDGVMVLLASFYSICDMICVLFFCPFQSFFLKNRCCTTCRIYNWDFAMMFTPFFFVREFYAVSLFVLSIILLAIWEISFFRHPERFSVNTNDYLRCSSCTEKLCSHKKQLGSLWKHIGKYEADKLQQLKK